MTSLATLASDGSGKSQLGTFWKGLATLDPIDNVNDPQKRSE